MLMKKSVEIAPGVSMLAVLSSLNYQPWYAMAEFVDNSIQSYLNSDRTESLRIYIDLDRERNILTIEDNAAGIAPGDFDRAFRTAVPPPDRRGLSEFGMGMKSAACWFSSRWSVTTSTRGDSTKYTVNFDIADIVESGRTQLEVEQESAGLAAHGTTVRLLDVHKMPFGRTVAKIRQHLADIYRVFLRRGDVAIFLNREALEVSEPEVLRAQHFNESDGVERRWFKTIEFSLPTGQSVSGTAGLLATGNQARAGLSLFRRDRVIEGSGDERWKPNAIYGAGNTYRSQRLFAELHLEGFDVSHTKDGFQWGEAEGDFLEHLYNALDGGDIPLLKQAEGFRVRKSLRQQERIVRGAVDRTATVAPSAIASAGKEIVAEPADNDLPLPSTEREEVYKRQFESSLHGVRWNVELEAANEAGADWMRYENRPASEGRRTIQITLNLSHPLLVHLAQNSEDSLELSVRFAVAMATADAIVRTTHAGQGAVLRNVSALFNSGLSDLSGG